MTTMNEAFVNALLADVVYVDGFVVGMTGVDLTNRVAGRMTLPLAKFIGDNFTVRVQSPAVASSFDATVWVGNTGTSYAGQVYVSVRGTQEGPDFAADVDLASTGLAHAQLADMVNWWLRETTPAGDPVLQIKSVAPAVDLVTGEVIDPREFHAAAAATGTGRLVGIGSITSVNGHSLGGYLASTFVRLFGQQWPIERLNTFNSAGFSRPATTHIENGFDTIARIIGPGMGLSGFSAAQNNFYALNGVNLTTNTWNPVGFDQKGERIGLYQEDVVSLPLPANNHYMYKLTDLLALGNALAQLDPTLDLTTLSALVRAGSNAMASSYEGVLDAFRKLVLGGDPTPTQAGDANAGNDGPQPAARVDFHANLEVLRTNGQFKALMGKTVIVSLANWTAEEIRAAATDADMVAVRYALQELNPFALLGADYGRFNAAGELDLYDPASGAGALSTDWIADRAGLLAAVLARNVADRTDNLIGGDIAYKDSALGLALGPNALPQTGVIFGSAAGESIAFTHTRGNRVHLYGMEGNDSLLGGTSADLLEGGAGDDQLRGGKGDDALLGGPGQDPLRGGGGADLLDGGAGGDRLHGGAGIDDYWIGRNSGIDVITDFADEGALSPLLALFSNRDEEGDGQGRLRYAGTLLEGTLVADPADGQTWSGFGLVFRFNGTPGKRGLLSITDPAGEPGHEIKVMAWKSGELGLTLGARPVIAKSTQNGTSTADVLTASAPKERVLGLAGDDRITVSLADAEGWGGPGRDWISNGDGDQKLYGEEGDDVLIASAGDDELYGGADNDALQGGADDDLLDGSDGADWLAGGSGSDVLEGGAGDDYLEGSSGWAPVGGSLPAVPAGATLLARGQQWWIARSADGTLSFSNWTQNPHFAPDEGDFLDGDAGDDTYLVRGGETIEISADTVEYLRFTDATVAAASIAVVIEGGAGGDQLWGSEGGDRLQGGGLTRDRQDHGRSSPRTPAMGPNSRGHVMRGCRRASQPRVRLVRVPAPEHGEHRAAIAGI